MLALWYLGGVILICSGLASLGAAYNEAFSNHRPMHDPRDPRFFGSCGALGFGLLALGSGMILPESSAHLGVRLLELVRAVCIAMMVISISVALVGFTAGIRKRFDELLRSSADSADY